MNDIIKEMRVKHWIKNFIIFVPLFFNKSLLDMNKLSLSIFAFLSFSFIASSIYIFNDLKDIEKDKKHPIKKNRPIASGRISKKKAIIFMVCLVVLSSISMLFINNIYVSLSIVSYFILNLFYTIKGKEIPIVDVSIIAIGFILRLLVGSFSTDIQISKWLYIIMFVLSYYLAFNKRKNEIISSGNETRKVLKLYTIKFLDDMINICLTLAIVFYSFWCVDTSVIQMHSPYLYLTIPLFLIIVMYYSYIVSTTKIEDPVVLILDNKILLVLFMIYGIFMYILVY